MSTNEPIGTVDIRQLNTLRWGPIREMFPEFVENIELGRYLKRLLATTGCRAVQLQARREPNGEISSHVFDVVPVGEASQVG